VRTALCPGSFDPIHLGHVEVIETAASLFDRLVVAVIRNYGKGEPLFSFEERVEILQEVLAHLDNVEITMMKKLTVDVCRDVGADWIARGLRAVSDFDYELQMAQMNEAISGIQTVFVPCASSQSFLSSSLIRDIARLGSAARVEEMLPAAVARRLKEKFADS